MQRANGPRSRAAIALLGLSLPLGCYSGLGEPEGMADPEGEEGSGVDASDPGPSPWAERESSVGLRLLTQREFHNAVRDLLGVSLDRRLIPQEVLIEGHGHISRGQGAGLEEVDRYYELGIQAAQEAMPQLDPGCDLGTLPCATGVAEDLLDRAFRRPIDAEQRDRYLGILEAAEAGDDVSQRLETFIATVLSSPDFLYRRELGDEPVDGNAHIRRLTEHEIASRLSFLVWQSGPDEELLDLARAGKLRDPDTRVEQLERMLLDERSRVGQMGFVADWMGLAAGGGTIEGKDPEVLEGTLGELASSAEQSFERTVQSVLFEGTGRFTGLLAAGEYWVDEAVAQLLDLPSAGVPLEARELDPQVRQGILMHPAVLAAHTKESGASPFPVGKFLYENLLCEKIGSPPELPEPEEAEGQTLREQLEAQTAGAACQTCHALIGPPGFAFMAFDPLGRFSAEDPQGRPFDTSGSVPVGDGTVSFDSAAEFSVALSESDDTARCVAKRLYRWTYGHFEGSDTKAYLQQLEEASVSSGAGMQELLSAIVASDEFSQVRLGD